MLHNESESKEIHCARPIRSARLLGTMSCNNFCLPAIAWVIELNCCQYISRRNNVISGGNSCTGKTLLIPGIVLAACQRCVLGIHHHLCLVHELMEARDERRFLNVVRQPPRLNQLLIDKLDVATQPRTWDQLPIDAFGQRYEPGSIMVTINPLTSDIGFPHGCPSRTEMTFT